MAAARPQHLVDADKTEHHPCDRCGQMFPAPVGSVKRTEPAICWPCGYPARMSDEDLSYRLGTMQA